MQNTLPSTPTKTAQLQPKQITTKCPTCKNSSVAITDIESGEIICSKYGIVITERIEETGQEWHIFESWNIGDLMKVRKSRSFSIV